MYWGGPSHVLWITYRDGRAPDAVREFRLELRIGRDTGEAEPELLHGLDVLVWLVRKNHAHDSSHDPFGKTEVLIVGCAEKDHRVEQIAEIREALTRSQRISNLTCNTL